MPESYNNSPQSNKSVIIKKCRIVSQYGIEKNYALAGLNHIDSIKSIEIYEDIFTTAITGNIVFQDQLSLSTLFRLDGSEDLHLCFSVYNPATGTYRDYGTEDKPLIFSMYAQQKRVHVTKGVEQFEVKLISAEAFGASEYRISKTYKNQFIEDIVQDIIRNGLNSDKPFTFIEKTTTPITMTIPFLTPLQAIKLLCMHGQNESDDSNYLFYETLAGFEFRSLRSIINNEMSRDNVPTVRQTLGGTRKERDNDQIITADVIEVTSGYDLLYSMVHGYFASTTYALDLLAGACKKTVSTINDTAYKNRKLLNSPKGTPIYPNAYGSLVNPTSKIFLVPTTEVSYKTALLKNKDMYIHDNKIGKTLHARNRELVSLQLRTVRVVVSGAPELRAGTVVNIEPLQAQKQEGSSLKDISTGKYIILSSKHSIINTGYGYFVYETAFEAGTDSNSV